MARQDFPSAEIKASPPLKTATIRPNAYSLIARPCCQEFSGDPDHHDKPSSRAARHDRSYGDAFRSLLITRANRAAGCGADSHRCRPRRQAQGAAEGSAREADAADGCPPGEARAASAATTAAACGTTTAAATACAAAAACPAAATATAAARPGACGTESGSHRFAEPNGDAPASAEARAEASEERADPATVTDRDKTPAATIGAPHFPD